MNMSSADSQTGSQAYGICYIGRSSNQFAKHYADRLERLQRNGFDVHVLAAPDGGLSRLTDREIQTKQIPTSHPWNLPGLVASYPIIQGYLLEHRPVLVHVFDDLVAYLGAFAAREASVPSVFASIRQHPFVTNPIPLSLDSVAPFPPKWLHLLENKTNNAARPAVTKIATRAIHWLGRHVDKYLVTNPYDRDVLTEFELVDETKLEVIAGGRGIDLETFDPDDDDTPTIEDARTEFEIPESWRRVIGYKAPFTTGYGADDLLELIRQVARTDPAVGWLVWSESNSAPWLQRQLQKLRRDYNIRVIGPNSSIGASVFYRALDFFVAPYYRPIEPYNAMEAAAMKVPTIGYTTPGLRGAIEEGQTGRIVPQGQLEEFEDVIRQLLTSPKTVTDLGIRARGRATSRFNREVIDDQVLKLYDSSLETALKN